MMLVPFCSEVFDRIQWYYILKSPNVICMNQQVTYWCIPRGYSSGTLYHTSKWKGGPPPAPPPLATPPPALTSTQLNISKNRLFFAALHPLLQNGAFFFFFTCFGFFSFLFFYLFRRTDTLLQGFLLLLRSILSEPGDEKTCLRGFWPVKIQTGLLSYRC